MKIEPRANGPGQRAARRLAGRDWGGLWVIVSLLLAACAATAKTAEPKRESVELSVLTPDAGWVFRVREVRETDQDVWVWAELQRRPGLAAQQLTTVKASAMVPTGKPRTVFITGKTWRWANEEPYRFVERHPEWPAGSRVVPQS
jgi:hypothetical protein